MAKTRNTDSGLFIDEFRAELKSRELSLPGELEEAGGFCDLAWRPPSGKRFDVGHYITEDPAIVVIGYSRWVAFWRIEGEIRYYAARNPPGAQPWYWSGENPARVAAVDAESDYYEIAILRSVQDAVLLTTEYLSGKSLADIEVTRIKPS
jgi:hypothetical protein